MDTLRVDICYRPLRIGWVIKSDDFDSYRTAVKYSHALWGGRFNPILLADKEEYSGRIIDLFRVDVLIPIGESDEVINFPDKYPYLLNPFYGNSVFFKGDKHSHPESKSLDIHNALVYLRDKPDWEKLKEIGFNYYYWDEDDPLSDLFLSHFGKYPDKEEVGRDYLELFEDVSECLKVSLDSKAAIPGDVTKHPTISYLTRHGLSRLYGRHTGWDAPGFFVGNVEDIEDLVCFWNLRACDISLWFVDPKYIDRYSNIIPKWEERMLKDLSKFRSEWDREVTVWARKEYSDIAHNLFEEKEYRYCEISDGLWNGRDVRAPFMHLGEVSVLGVVSGKDSKPEVSFALTEKPFCDNVWYYQQQLVASISFIGGLYGDDGYTLVAPYLPELNEFYARTMHFQYDKFRIEPERIGLIIGVNDKDSFIRAMPVSELFNRVFGMAGYNSKLSNAGLITKQLISRLGGLEGARVFKIPGARRLLKTHGSNASITKRTALQLIGSKDSERPDAEFNQHEDLYIERRERRDRREKLSQSAVFGYLVEKGLFRIGSDLMCPSCRMNSWVPLDSLKHKIVCDLCGNEHDVTRKLTDSNQWNYRRSGVLGVEKNAQGALPVVLTLQQLNSRFLSGIRSGLYSPSLDLSPKESIEGINCEIDFAWIIPRTYPQKTVIILAECKDQGPITEQEINNLKLIIDAFPRKRFKTFAILSQISQFSNEQVKFAQSLNDKYRRRCILLTAKELEYHLMIHRQKDEEYEKLRWSTPEDMADSTAELYFTSKE